MAGTIRLEIITNEHDGVNWFPVLSHKFYELEALVQAHRQNDQFFNASFSGHFNGIALKNNRLIS